MSSLQNKVTKEESLELHRRDPRGKIAMAVTKPMKNQRDLSLAYSPGVGYPCLEIKNNPELIYEYTNKGNTVAVISNGTAVLGFGDIGHLASKPVMEGKSGLMKTFAGVDSVDIIVKSKKLEEVISTVVNIADTFGAINLEDIKAPECFLIEEEIQKQVKIPIFHDDQHGTATVTLAGIINASRIAKKDPLKMKYVINGAGAAGIASARLLMAFGVPKQNIVFCDTGGVIFKGRISGMNQYKEEFASETMARTLAEAVEGCDVLIGLSVKGAFTKEMIQSMANNPIVFAMANPDPEMLPEDIKMAVPNAIVATGRSDYPNQVNNLLCFPYLFRALLDTRSTCVKREMLLSAAKAISSIVHLEEEKSDRESYSNRQFNADYIVPTIFDRRLLPVVSCAVAEVAISLGVAKKQLDINSYRVKLSSH